MIRVRDFVSRRSNRRTKNCLTGNKSSGRTWRQAVFAALRHRAKGTDIAHALHLGGGIVNRRIAFVAVCLLLVLPTTRANAAIIIFSGTLTGSQETPPTGSPGTGSVTATLDTLANTLFVSEVFSNLVAPSTAAHIHCCVPPGVGPAAVALNFVGFPIGVTSGAYSHTFNLLTDLSGISAPVFIAALEGGLAYTNVHSQSFPGGEIRAQLTAVPEPASIFLCATGLLAVRRSLRRRT
jgi:hypothetical protein